MRTLIGPGSGDRGFGAIPTGRRSVTTVGSVASTRSSGGNRSASKGRPSSSGSSASK